MHVLNVLKLALCFILNIRALTVLDLVFRLVHRAMMIDSTVG